MRLRVTDSSSAAEKTEGWMPLAELRYGQAMRRKAATALVALLALAATPSALARGTVTINSRIVAELKGLPLPAVPVALTRKDHSRSCQVGASRSAVRPANETERKAATVACEQPPRSTINLPGGIKAAEAGALAAGG
jgi:hypothetical protein